MALTELKIKSLTSTSKIQKISDGGGVILPLLMDRISRIKCSSMAAYRRWLDEAFHGCKTTANEWHGLQHRSNY